MCRVQLRGKGAHKDTLFFKKDFEAAAAEFAGRASGGRHARLESGQQLSPEWHKLRDARLTASTFGNALGCVCFLLIHESNSGIRSRVMSPRSAN